MMPIDVVIMAAGKGTRMKSKTPKVLHILGAKPLLGHVLDAAQELSARKIIVITGHESELVRAGATTFFERCCCQGSSPTVLSPLWVPPKHRYKPL